MFSFTRNKAVAVVPIIVFICVLAAFGAMVITKENDTPVEQAAEAVIKSETGIDFDFSPDDKTEEQK